MGLPSRHTLSVLVAKGRAQVAVAAANGDWSKRIRDMQYTDHEDYTGALRDPVMYKF